MLIESKLNQWKIANSNKKAKSRKKSPIAVQIFNPGWRTPNVEGWVIKCHKLAKLPVVYMEVNIEQSVQEMNVSFRYFLYCIYEIALQSLYGKIYLLAVFLS